DEESDKDLVAVHEIYDQEDWDLAMATVQSGDIVQLANELDAKIEYRGDPFDPDANTGEPITFTMTREGPPQ
ncbi:MAG: hypothetical protein GY930_01925, partial [bacterium]|nr:hypothetical protein [bacterium]